MLTVICGDALEKLHGLPAGSVQCCVTSPPYWGLRDYGTAQWEGGEHGCEHREKNVLTAQGGSEKQKSNNGANHVYSGDCICGAKRIDSQLGLEKTPEEYVAKMVEVFREVRRVLRKDGTLWLNLGDSYASAFACDRRSVVGNDSPDENCKRPNRLSGALKEKDLCGIPWRVAFALQADGWWLRSDIIWAKPNPMPESVTDRPTKAHEYLFLLTKSASYFYDAEAIKEPSLNPEDDLRRMRQAQAANPVRGDSAEMAKWTIAEAYAPNGRNKRTVWTVPTHSYPEAHFATYPPDLIKPCIMAGCPQKVCSVCLTPMVSSKDETEISEPDTIQTELQRVRGVLRRPQPEVLQQVLFDEGSRQTEETQASSMQAMRTDVQSPESRRPVLSSVLHDMAKGTGAARTIGETNMAGRTPAELEGRNGVVGGLRQALGSEREEIQIAASNSYGTGDGQEITESRNCASSQRNQDGQSPRESSFNDQESAHGDRNMSSLQGDVCDSLSPCCGAPWTPGTVLDCFAGSGTTGAVALELGRKAVLIELNSSYCELIEQRCSVTLGLALA